MTRMEEIVENIMIDSWARKFLRAPFQKNTLHETDAELIELPGDPDHFLAVTIDTVCEEIAFGLYRDPHTMGWVTVMSSLSDLAAVGATPLGLVIATSIEPHRDKMFSSTIAQGMEDACRASGVFILGGDTNDAPSTSLTSCAVGIVSRKDVMRRSGCSPGDVVFATAAVGSGNALGLVRLADMLDGYFPESLYRPMARLREGAFLRTHANCCMDTSDGLLATLDQLMRINLLGFKINCEWQRILAPEVVNFCERSNTPYWLMTAGPHGEFELLFTIPAEGVEEFLALANSRDFKPIKLGTVQGSPAISLVLPSGHEVEIDAAKLRNLLYTVEGDSRRFLEEIRSMGYEWGLLGSDRTHCLAP